ncbi:MAG: hypothetical protein KF791_19025 [Verrucomicrobiae bacterium]|nr:hypothetical protein [Verrucomicrobiae bacterium]
MHQANVSYSRNHPGELLARVREGGTILIVDRQQPAARPEAVGEHSGQGWPWQEDLVRRGLIRLARHRLDMEAMDDLPWPQRRRGGDIVASLRAEREEGR